MTHTVIAFPLAQMIMLGRVSVTAVTARLQGSDCQEPADSRKLSHLSMEADELVVESPGDPWNVKIHCGDVFKR